MDHRRPFARSAASFAAVTLFLLLGSGAFAHAGSRDGCVLVTQADIEKLFGQSVTKGDRKEGSCAWNTGTPVGGMTIDVIDASAARMTKGSKPSIEGLGDDAFWAMKMKPAVILTVIRGDVALMISVQFPIGRPAKVDDLEATAQEIARIALERL